MAAVTTMECASLTLQNRRERRLPKRSQRRTGCCQITGAQRAFIDAVNFANKLADSFGVEKIYTGGPERRDYGDFLPLPSWKEIYGNRQ